jgi:predicted NUDIX family NTP pyrophosphohydrolase
VTAMPKRSAGLLLFRRAPGGLEVLLGHPGGPFFARKDEGVWSIPKGEIDDDEEPRAAALREFAEETGTVPPDRDLLDLGEIRQRSGKLVRAWAAEGDLDAGAIVSNTFALEWPPRSGRQQTFPEIDRAEWFGLEEAARRMVPAQAQLLDRLAERAG